MSTNSKSNVVDLHFRVSKFGSGRRHHLRWRVQGLEAEVFCFMSDSRSSLVRFSKDASFFDIMISIHSMRDPTLENWSHHVHSRIKKGTKMSNNETPEAIDRFVDQNGYAPNSLTRAIAANPALRALPSGQQRTAFEATFRAIQGLQLTVETMLGRQLAEDEATELWQKAVATLSTIVISFATKLE
jgi:hypothetical protein